jgi:hypothetical protein
MVRGNGGEFVERMAERLIGITRAMARFGSPLCRVR